MASLARGIAQTEKRRPSGDLTPLPAPEVLFFDAAAAVREGNTKPLRHRLEQTFSLTDPLQRYRIQRALIAGAFAGLQTIEGAALPAAFSALADLALAVLETEPAQPLFLNWAGVALYELWLLRAAAALFEAALRLDPQLEDAKRNLQALAARKRLLGRRPEPALHPLAKSLTPRALALAERARPATGLTVSLCMIVRDEEEMLGGALESVGGAVDEIIVVDTGSTDRTVEIAHAFGARVFEVAWENSFSLARNYSLEQAHGDWILYLDADERLVAADRAKLRELLGHTWREAIYLKEHSYTGSRRRGTGYAHDALRLFRNRPQYRFEGRLHEQLGQALPFDLPEKLERSDVRVEHLGYLEEVRVARQKTQRNLALLELEGAESKHSSFYYFNLGTTYGAEDRAQEAVEAFAKAWRLAEEEPQGFGHSFLPALAVWYVTALASCGKLEEAIAQANRGLEIFPDHSELLFRRARCQLLRGEWDRAREDAKRCLELGSGPNTYAGAAGSASYLARTLLGELALREGRACEAKEELATALAHNSTYLEAIEPFCRALLALDYEPQQAEEELRKTVGTITPPIRFMFAKALLETGASALAASHFKQVVRDEPQAHQAAVALAEITLMEGDYAAVLEAAAAVGESAPARPKVERLALLARLLRGDPDFLRVLAESALGPQEREVFARLAGAPSPPLEEGHRVPLMSLLGRLLELRQFKRFEAALPLLEEVLPEARQRRHALAELYLAKGYYASAVREWMMLPEAKEDPQALSGLALAALATDRHEQARNLASHALARDPASMRAQEVLSALESAQR